MYAVIETGGKQYRVEVGTELEVELLDAEPGKTVTLDRVLLVADGDEAAIGRPLVGDASVSAEVLRRDRGEKLIVFKYRPKARSRVKKGHRQELTVLRISDIVLNGKSAAKLVAKADQDAKTERQRLEEAAAAQAAKDAQLAAKLAGTKTTTKAPAKTSSAKAAAKTGEAADAKASAKPAAKAKASPTATTEAKPATKAETVAKPKPAAKAAPKKPTAKAKSADAADEPTPKKSAPKRATKKDE
jgi:large subunit ribosomal protein L21